MRKYNPKTYLPNDDECFGDNSLRIWKNILYSIHFDEVSAYVLSIRKERLESRNFVTASEVELTAHPTIEKPALLGSFHIAFVIKFSDGIKWLLKVPATGYNGRFTDIEARALTSEALTMQFLKRETTIPLPEVYSYSSSLNNDLNCPFILMEYITGIPLHKCWYDPDASKEVREQHRVTALKDIASAMIQMNKFAFSQAGAPLFDSQENPTCVGPAKKYDTHAMWNKRSTNAHSDETAVYCEKGPFSDAKLHLLSMLDHRRPSTAPVAGDAFGLGVEILLRLFIDWIPSLEDASSPGSVLSHPDLNIQNVLVSQEGNLRSLIDWDGVAAVPRCLGNERYPSWLTRDWDPSVYNYRLGGRGPNEEGPPVNPYENSPEELKHYRALYASFISASNNNGTKKNDGSGTTATTATTRHSLIIENLQIAAEEETCTFPIVEKIYNEIVALQTGGQVTNNEDLEETDVQKPLYDVTLALAEGKRDEDVLAWINDGFVKLFDEAY